ncbi:MAG: 50S ribosomal protein L21 [Thermodesulfovibrionales bacterium]|nr:50S ribosomal protein L21 [Thermodesulfovibrionales bacterium]
MKIMYAIVETGGKQYKVSSGDTIKVDKLTEEAGSAVTLNKVLAVIDKKSKLGKPYVKGAEVKAEVIGAVKGDKVIVHKQRPRKVYRKTNGHRQKYTALKINEITVGGKDGA